MIRWTGRGLMVLLCGLFLFSGKAYAQEAVYQDTEILVQGFSGEKSLTDDNINTYAKAQKDNQITVIREDGIGGIYIKFDRIPSLWTLEEANSGEKKVCGENAFLHEFVDVKDAYNSLPKALTLTFEEDTSIADIYVFSEGELPNWVQKWEEPCEAADILLFSSHSDDEQLFFLGLLPYYAGECRARVQVAYVIQHFEVNGVENHQRPHEQLDGLWTVGVRNYPVMSEFPDLYSEGTTRENALENAKKTFEAAGYTYDDFVSYMTETIRRFKPQVVISHDLDGEYGHGTHILAAQALTEAITYTGDENQYPDSAKQYGTWDIKKLYLHLYEENQIVMDYDVPLESFGGKTAYEVSCMGFDCHKSQHWTWFYKWIYGKEGSPITKASQIRTYSPCKYGLYYTSVGEDVECNDFLENIETYDEQMQSVLKEGTKRLIEETQRLQRRQRA